MFRLTLTGAHEMMRCVFDRLILVAAAVAAAAIGSASLAHADPHGSGHSPSYQNGYSAEHDYYSIPRNHEYLKNEMRQDGYNAGLVCQVEINGGPQPASVTDWINGCVDALHDLGFKP
jgi:hypothetical protein